MLTFIRARVLLASFRRNGAGSIGQIFALSLIPLLGLTGAAIDYSRAANEQARLAFALDNALVAGARDGTSNWQGVASSTFANFYGTGGGTLPTPQFTSPNANQFSAAVTASMPTTLLTHIGISSIPITASAKANGVAGDSDNSCILLLDPNQALTHQPFSRTGTVALSGCSIRSNTSLNCSGYSTGASEAVAAGTVSNCANPKSNAKVTTDIYSAVASNITSVCTSFPGATWTPSAAPTASRMVTVTKSTHVEYHVCGDLTFTGSGTLAGTSTGTDSIIVIENGKLDFGNDATITAPRTAIVFTGNNTVAPVFAFPTGAANGATLTISPPTNTSNPWAGIAIYQDPALTNGATLSWKNNSTLNVAGVVYLPRSTFTMAGAGSSPSSTSCTKLVVGMLSVTGSLNLNHNTSACTSLGVKQWATATQVSVTQ